MPTRFALGTHDANIGKPGLDVDVSDYAFGGGPAGAGCIISIRNDRITGARAVHWASS